MVSGPATAVSLPDDDDWHDGGVNDAVRHHGSHSERAPADSEPPLPVSIVLVAGLALVHVVMAASLDSVSTSVIDLVEPLFGAEPARLAATVTPWIPLVVVLFIWTHEQRLGLLAAAVALAIATLPYLRGVFVEQLLTSGDEDGAVRLLDWSDWLLTGLLPLGAALAWGIARRQGTRWWPGLAVAVVVAVLFRWLDLDAFGDDPAMRQAFAATVYHVVPAVLAGLACWALDVRTTAP
jgi:hypothetical protein